MSGPEQELSQVCCNNFRAVRCRRRTFILPYKINEITELKSPGGLSICLYTICLIHHSHPAFFPVRFCWIPVHHFTGFNWVIQSDASKERTVVCFQRAYKPILELCRNTFDSAHLSELQSAIRTFSNTEFWGLTIYELKVGKAERAFEQCGALPF